MATKTLKPVRRQATMGRSPPIKGQGMAAMNERDPNTSTYSGRVAARIRKLRKDRQMERSELHAALERYGVKVSMPSLYAYENGNRPVNPDHYPAFAKALGCKSVRAFLPAD